MATITLNWTPVNDANSTGQIVQRALASGGGWSDIASLGANENTYVDTTAVFNVLYTYRIVNVCLEGGPTPSSEVSKGKPLCPDLQDPILASGTATMNLPTLMDDAVYGSYTLLDSTNNLVLQGPISGTPNFQGPLTQVLSGLGSNEGYTYTFEVIVGTDKIVCEKRFTSSVIVACYSYTAGTSEASAQMVNYTDCSGAPQSFSIGGVNGWEASSFCAQEDSISTSGNVLITLNGPCDEPKTVTVTGAYGSMEPCIGGTIDDFMSASINLDTSVTVDTIFQVDVYWSERNSGGCVSPNTQSFWVPVKAGQSSGSLNACTNGAYYPSGADICSAAAVSHDNTVDNIIL